MEKDVADKVGQDVGVFGRTTICDQAVFHEDLEVAIELAAALSDLDVEGVVEVYGGGEERKEGGASEPSVTKLRESDPAGRDRGGVEGPPLREPLP